VAAVLSGENAKENPDYVSSEVAVAGGDASAKQNTGEQGRKRAKVPGSERGKGNHCSALCSLSRMVSGVKTSLKMLFAEKKRGGGESKTKMSLTRERTLRLSPMRKAIGEFGWGSGVKRLVGRKRKKRRGARWTRERPNGGAKEEATPERPGKRWAEKDRFHSRCERKKKEGGGGCRYVGGKKGKVKN